MSAQNRKQADGSACWYCGSDAQGRRTSVREMYFGSRQRFDYLECADCRSWRIETIPSDLSRHYPKDYGAHGSPAAVGKRARGPRQWVRVLRTDARIGRFGPAAAKWVENAYRELSPYPWRWLRMAGVNRDASILDVGCGNGSLLRALHAEGFNDLTGIDRFYPAECRLPGLTLRVGDVFDVHGRFNLVMLHHSLEHMPEPIEVLRQSKQLLEPDGTLLVRVPLADCVAHREYGEHWFQIDAPRHLAVPSVHGMFAIAERLGLEPVEVDFDSSATQFEASEGYRHDVPLVEQRRRHQDASALRSASMAFKARSEALNRMHLGDMAAFLFRSKD
ncbi:MAG TPA: class I SAM-dependent methyltransferase [Rubrivivax sp.]|nr:class I SAM-dependent methyltransferase [Rubrivivax sp.]